MSQDFCEKAVNAILEDRAEYNKIVDDLILKDSTNSAVLQRIKDKGSIDSYENTSIVRYGNAMPAPVNIPEKRRPADCPEDRYQEVKMKALEQCANGNGEFGTLGNPDSTLDCNEKPCTVPTNLGHEIIDFVDFYKEFQTDISCAKTLYDQGKHHIMRANDNKLKVFSEFLVWNFKKNLLQQVTKLGEANSSMLGQSIDNIVSPYGFVAPPKYTLYWDHLRLYRQYLISQGALDDMNGVLSLEGLQEDALRAIRQDQKDKYGDCATNITPYEDTEGKMKGRKFVEYDQIRIYFNEKPRKFYVKQASNGRSEYVEIFPWKNSAERAKAGLLREPNRDYWKSQIECDGQLCPVVIALDHIHPDGMYRYGMNGPLVHEGRNVGLNLKHHPKNRSRPITPM